MVANINKPLTEKEFKSYSRVEVLKHTKLWISPGQEEFWTFDIYEYGTSRQCSVRRFHIYGDDIPTNYLLNYLRKMYVPKFSPYTYMIRGREVAVNGVSIYNCEDALFYLNADIKQRHDVAGNHAVFIYGYKEPFYMPENMRGKRTTPKKSSHKKGKFDYLETSFEKMV